MTKSELAVYRRRREKILRLIGTGLSQAEVGRRLKMKRQRVNQILSKHGKA